MVKDKAKRNNRQRKKLRVDGWRQWSFQVIFDYESSTEDESLIDELFDIAELHNCWMAGFLDDGVSTFIFHNKKFLEQGINCQIAMADKLKGMPHVSNIKLGFDKNLG